ncbi:MAG: DUF3048 domain-containing protein [Actinobacteria bacterium]|nr:DUF3048 domain-containing protein [Actinomycetota bacterium]
MRFQWTRRRAIAASLVAAVVAAIGLTALTGAGPLAGLTGATSPFTGEPVSSLRPVIAVKIDNIVFARPQTGIGKADLVYVIPVEGGLSRFMAVFSSSVPKVIGPVRSAREDDLALLMQFGRPAFAYSGAQPQLLPVVEHARTVDLYSNRVGGYYRDNGRIAPYNLYARGPALEAEAKGASVARDIGFRFGPPPATGGVPTASVSAGYSAASFSFTWSASHHTWIVSMDGQTAMTTDTDKMNAPTVVIQHTVVRKSRFIEWGALPPYADSTGSGTAQVLRDGRVYQARWSRPSLNGGTKFTTPTGEPMNFERGPVWIVLEP